MTTTRTLVLWDVDGTLVNVHGTGRRAFALAIHRTWGIEDDLHDVNFAGATDLGVLAQLRARLPLRETDFERFFSEMAVVLEELLAATPANAPAGTLGLVDALSARAHVLQGLVTGNAKPTAKLKLRSAGFDPARFQVGGFGDEHPDRNELARRALERAKTHGAWERVVLVGDTPSDVRAARAIGAVAVGVNAKEEGRAALSAAGADHVFEELSEGSGAMDVVVGGGPG